MESRPPHERRREVRHAVSASGRIWFGPEYGLWADCKIADRSVSGARIEVSAVYRLPRRLIFAHYSVETLLYGAILKWQRGDAAGLALEPYGDVTKPWYERISRELRALNPSGV